MLGLTRPYRGALIGFLCVTVVLSATVAVVPALLFGALFDDAVGLKKDAAGAWRLALAAVGVAVRNQVLGLPVTCVCRQV